MRFLRSTWSRLTRVSVIVFIFIFGIEMQEANLISDDKSSNVTESNASSQALAYLKRFGYLLDRKQSSSIVTNDTSSKVITKFQIFAELGAADILDNNTSKLRWMDRYGLKDKPTSNLDSHHKNRVKRYTTQGSKWNKHNLTYKIITYPQEKKLNKSTVDNEIARAFSLWSQHTDLTFQQVQDGPADIEIQFVIGGHNDGHPFSDSAYILAYASSPDSGGFIHFNNHKYWTAYSSSGVNLFQTALHEIGHVLGLGHSKTGTTMQSFSASYDSNFQLHSDDIKGIQAIYGSKTMGSTRKNGSVPGFCKLSKIDAVFRTKEYTYYFRGDYYWTMVGGKMVDEYSQRINNTWPGLVGNIDAALCSDDTIFFFFKGSKCWIYNGRLLNDDFPIEISSIFPGIPSYIDAATLISRNKYPYFFKGPRFYSYDNNSIRSVKVRRIKAIFNSFLFKNGVDAADLTSDHITLFKDVQYYTYDRKTLQVISRGRFTDLFGCPKE